MSFIVAADAYDRFMGRYSAPLAPVFLDFTGLPSGRRVLDVGCGPGALTAELVRRQGPGLIAAVDPSEPFVAALRQRHPEVEVRTASAEHLPFDDGSFDAACAQLVVHFMADPVGGLREMARVTRVGGVVAACVWDFADGGSPLSLFWRAAHDVDPAVGGEQARPGTHRGQLVSLFREAGLRDVAEAELTVHVDHATFVEWWDPFTLGVGPAGAYLAGLDTAARDAVEARCRELLPEAPFRVTAGAWAARGRVP